MTKKTMAGYWRGEVRNAMVAMFVKMYKLKSSGGICYLTVEEDGIMRNILPIFLALMIVTGSGLPVQAASQKAAALRQANGLTEFTPPEKFLAGNFVADEMNPAFVFGPVQAFAKSRKCPTAWLIETGSKNQPEKLAEYTLYLEEDCPDKVVYYVFVDQSGLTPQQWFEWRQKFHKSKAEPQYGLAQTRLEQACKEGCGFTAELRYIQKDGELLTAKSPEAVLRDELKFAPLYDLNLQKKLSK